MKLFELISGRAKYWILLVSGLMVFACRSDKSEEMVKILAKIHQESFKRTNPFSPKAEIAFYDSMSTLAQGNPYKSFITDFYKANAYLKNGEETKAVTLLETILPMALTKFQGNAERTLTSLGIASLRLAERQNCVNNHTAESCVIPIINTGIHKIKGGSRRAIEVYETILSRNPYDYEAQWLLNIAYMTIGEYPAKVPAQYLIPDLDKDKSGYNLNPFTDVAPGLNLNLKNKAGGTILEDFDNDGYLDIVISDLGLDGSMHYFKNNANNTFSDVSEKSGLSRFKGGLNIMQTDYNNDGFIDIFVLRGAWMPDPFGKQPNSLLKNNGNGTFTDVTIDSGLYSLHPTQAGVWRDFNNDGWLDLFIGNETANMGEMHGCELYINNKNGTFTDITIDAGCDLNLFIKGVTAGDYDNDGWQDIFISTHQETKVLLKNKGVQKNGKLKFEDVTQASGLSELRNFTFPTWFWDYDNDGWLDIFVCGYQADHSMAYSVATDALGIPNRGSKMYLFKNNHDGTFRDVSVEAGISHSIFAMGSNFGDIDNDGYPDMYLGTGNPDYQSLVPNKLFRNIGGKKFADATVSARVGNLQKGHGVGISDLDNDGDQDIFIEVGGAYPGDSYNNSLYLNPGQNNNRWIKLILEGKISNRLGIGARIKVTFKENGISRSVYQDLSSGGSFGSSSLRREIGIGEANIIDEISIIWPGSGTKQVFRNIKPNQLLKITEGNNKPKEISIKTLNFGGDNKNIPICITPAVKAI
ncbi:CRTAC1 family protein [Emticicia sp. TH156]|uniref:CRTAC1 family protein n=1 Tax=Emticicia sp. TH156 TaxID=2067454 RepID=UPI0013040A18|nr:CRTAC1 family protein [Emticicia sp. TH156]